jgi:hypothetical protein
LVCAIAKKISADQVRVIRCTVPAGPSSENQDPYERADITSNTYYDWMMSDGAGVLASGPAIAGQFLATFKDYPPSQRPSSFSIDQIWRRCSRASRQSAADDVRDDWPAKCRPVN